MLEFERILFYNFLYNLYNVIPLLLKEMYLKKTPNLQDISYMQLFR